MKNRNEDNVENTIRQELFSFIEKKPSFLYTKLFFNQI